MNEQFEKQIQETIPKIKDKLHILHFSTGADSVACYLRLKEWGIKPILIYDYFLPHIPMVDNYIDYFEKKFNVKVYKLPSKLYAQHIDNALYQCPVKSRENFRNEITPYELWKWDSNRLRKKILQELGLKKERVVFHKGIRYTDGQLRYISIKKNGVYHKDGSFFPIASFKISDIQNILRKYGCKLPIEYKLWGISLEAPRSWNIGLIRENCPTSYEYICKYFPMIKLLEHRDEFNKLNQHFKIRLTQFAEFAMEKDLYKVW